MRMWPVAPPFLCDRHLLGEHLELHMIVGSILKGNKLDGYYEHGLIDTNLIPERHEALVQEMTARGMLHKSPLPEFVNPQKGFIDPHAGVVLVQRCEKCRKKQ